ncbi:hypothetical protein [Cytobacillus firmus]|uniref:hypothetical protein n=1 Tax=Cytobacillus firmus TaxID=1399 RepID=UPI002494A4BB|nr:hypothetical protein [Cytobacillus firmus]
MNNLFQLSTLLSLVFIFIFVSKKNKKDLSLMSAMMVAMVAGMSFGVSFGLLFGAYLQGNLLFSTIFSLVIGGVGGALIGAVFGILPAVEGFFTGLMSGMMGAMLAEMMQPLDTVILLKFFVMLIFCSIALINLLNRTTNHQVRTRFWFLKPIILIILLISYLVTSDMSSQNFDYDHPKLDDHKFHEH